MTSKKINMQTSFKKSQLALALMISCGAQNAYAKTFVVDSLSPGSGVFVQQTTLRDAIEQANESEDDDNVIVFDSSLTADGSATISEINSLEVDGNKTLTIIGPGKEKFTISSAGAPKGSFIFSVSNDGLELRNITIDNGNSDNSGLDVIKSGAELITLNDVIISNSGAASDLTGININSGGLSLKNTTISGMTNGAVFISNNLVDEAKTIDIVSSTISGNSSTSGSAGMSVSLTGTGTLDDQAYLTDINITNSTFSGNTTSATSGAGAISIKIDNTEGMIGDVGSLNVLNSTIVENSATGTSIGGHAGGIFINNSKGGNVTLDLKNSILANNSTGDAMVGNDIVMSSDLNDANLILNSQYSLIGDNSNFGEAMPMLDMTNIVSVDPMLDPLSDNGGPTLTHNPQEGSMAINMGDNELAAALSRDQRDFSRVIDGTVDIGAIEFGSSKPRSSKDDSSAISIAWLMGLSFLLPFSRRRKAYK